MPRSTALVVKIVSLTAIGVFAGFAGCGFAPAAPGGAGANGGPLGTGNSSGTGLVGGGAAQNGQGAITGMNCAEVPQQLNKLPPDILLILDRSGSMNASADGTCENNCGANSKWSQTIGAVTQVIAATDTEVNWGLKFFTSPNGGTCGVNNGVEHPIAPNNATTINNTINNATTGGSTPTRVALQAGTTYMSTLTDQNPKFLLLATDGLPNCAPGASMTSDSDMAGAVSAVAAAATAGFPTFVVGVATTSDPTSDQTLSMMATAGGRPRAGTPAYYPVMNQADLVAALNQIVVIAGSCVFTIPPPPNMDTDANHIGVKVNGVEISKDTTHTNGWDYSGTNQVEIFGPRCTEIMNGTATSVQIVFKCIIN
jgi:hypothetical protein